jgi:hypothetical protein
MGRKMTQAEFTLIQDALIYVFQDIVGYWLSGLAALTVLWSLLMIFDGLFRWLTGKGNLI